MSIVTVDGNVVSTLTVGTQGPTGPTGPAGPAVLTVVINPQVGTEYPLALVDAGALVTCDNPNAVTVTIPLASSVAFVAGTRISVAQLGAGAVTITGAAGVTVNGTDGGTSAMSGAYQVRSLVRLAADTWLVT